MRKCFGEVGLAQDTFGQFKKYTNHRLGKIKRERAETSIGDGVTFAEATTEVEVLQREGVESEDEGEEAIAEGEGARRKAFGGEAGHERGIAGGARSNSVIADGRDWPTASRVEPRVLAAGQPRRISGAEQRRATSSRPQRRHSSCR